MSTRRSWVLVPAFFAIALAALGLSAYSGASSSQGFAPVQPVDFPHPVHVQTLGMNCLYCHYAANKSPDPGLPAVGTCQGCHAVLIGPQRPARPDREAFRSAPLDTLHRYAPPNQVARWQPIPWVRIHKLPEYVRFPHMRHVNAGVTCQSCHGPIQTMNRVYQFASLNMGWCVNCHVRGYDLRQGLLAAGDSAGAAAVPATTQPRKARYDCSVCHY
jgi:hypothetical protein